MNSIYQIFLFCSIIVPIAWTIQITYEGIGTFRIDDFWDAVYRPLSSLPLAPSLITPNFKLFTRNNRDKADYLLFNDTDSVKASHFRSSAIQTKVIIHGFIDNQIVGFWMKELKNKLLYHDDLNVIVVDWSVGALPPYIQATVNTRVIGAMVAIQIETICQAMKVTPDSFHLIGHSLGSHVSGYAGKFLNGTLGRITGLDPAGPYFEGLPSEGRLWFTDAQFVDAIHTDALYSPVIKNTLDRLMKNALGFGMHEMCAHVDFYPNQGSYQPGCPKESFASILDGAAELARRVVSCSHQRAVDLYMDSLDRTQPLAKAYQCDSAEEFTDGKCTDCGQNGEKCALMGERAIEYNKLITNKSIGADKRFYLVTDYTRPLLTKYQFIITLWEEYNISLAIDEIGSSKFIFYDTNNKSESVDISRRNVISQLFSTIFNSNQQPVYSIAEVVSIDPSKLDRIQFQWFQHFTSMFMFWSTSATVPLKRIQVIGLTSSQSTSNSPANALLTFCNDKTNFEIKKETIVTFHKC